MAKFPYSPTPQRVADFLTKIRTIRVPEKVTAKYMASIGFKSSNDRMTSSILKCLGFLDSSAVPTERWQGYRNKQQAPAVLALGIREAYSDLFDVYPDAYRKDDEALRDFFSSTTDASENVVGLTVRTFKMLSELADFGALAGEAVVTGERLVPGPIPEVTAPPAQGITVNVNIQLSLPATKDGSIYDLLFESLKKHLLSP